jgi:hypothetical protein
LGEGGGDWGLGEEGCVYLMRALEGERKKLMGEAPSLQQEQR